MLDPKAVYNLLQRLQAAGLLYPASSEEQGKARLEVWSASMNAEGGVTVAETIAAIVELARRTGDERLRPPVQPGHVLELIFDARRRGPRTPSHALPPAPVLTPDERRANVRRGLELIRAATEAVRGMPVEPATGQGGTDGTSGK